MVSKVSITGLCHEDKQQYLGILVAFLSAKDEFGQVNSIDRDGATILSSKTNLREGFKNAIKDFFQEQGIFQMPTLDFVD